VSTAAAVFSVNNWKMDSATLAGILLDVELLPLPLETGPRNTFNQSETRSASGVGVKEISIGPRARKDY
jgi:hypothetical protein